MRALVTGAAGFVGSNLSRALLDAGHTVVGVDALTDYYDPAQKRANLQALTGRSGFSFHEADLCEMDLPALLKAVDVVFHQAGQPGVRASWGKQFDVYTHHNISATQRLLEAARTTDLQAFVYASSSSVYGNAPSYPVDEETLPRPESPYGVSKLAAEHLCSLYASNFRVPTVSLRYFTVYGPGQRPDMAFHRFLRAATDGDPITIYGDGSQIRDFTYVGDIVAANVLAASGTVPPGTVLNLSGGSSVTVNEALDRIAAAVGRSLRIEYGAPLAGDVRVTGGSIDLARKVLQWEPAVSLDAGLRAELDWLQGAR